MKKTLVTVRNLDDFICGECGAFYQKDSMILTAGAKDELCRRGIRIQHGEAPAGSCCSGTSSGPCDAVDVACLVGASSVEDLRGRLAAMMEKQCAVSNPEQLRAASLKALDVLRAALD